MSAIGTINTLKWAIPSQSILNEEGKTGDCWRCCIAAVLQIPAEEDPHFVELSRQKNSSCDADTQRWLNERGWWMLHAHGDWQNSFGFPAWGQDRDRFVKPALIECGPTVRSQKQGDHHAVVTVAGELVYDPHPSKAGLIATVERYLIFPTHPASIK